MAYFDTYYSFRNHGSTTESSLDDSSDDSWDSTDSESSVNDSGSEIVVPGRSNEHFPITDDNSGSVNEIGVSQDINNQPQSNRSGDSDSDIEVLKKRRHGKRMPIEESSANETESSGSEIEGPRKRVQNRRRNVIDSNSDSGSEIKVKINHRRRYKHNVINEEESSDSEGEHFISKETKSVTQTLLCNNISTQVPN